MKYLLIMMLLMAVSVNAFSIVESGPNGLLNDGNITLFVTTDVSSTCNYVLDGGVGLMSGSLSHESQVFLSDGSYLVNFTCTNGTNNISSINTFEVNTQEAIITYTSWPAEIVTLPYQAEIKTSVSANCKYSENDEDYHLMTNTFTKESSTSHYIIIQNKPQELYSYYVKCVAESGLISSSVKEFFVNRKPTAQISLENDPLPAGTYEVTMQASETLSQIPSLYYYFNDDATLRPIALTGTGTIYKGYLILDENLGERIGTFSLSATDSSGLKGEEITSGKIFLVDTNPPKAPDSVEISIENEGVIIDWTFDDDFDEFVVYRGTSPNVEKVNQYRTTSKKSYVDKNVEDGVTYFYRVAAKDAAGNIGELSDEVEMFVLQSKTEELNPKLKYVLGNAIDVIETELFDYQEAKRLLESNKNTEAIQIDSAFGVIANLDTTITRIQTILNELKKLEVQDLTESQLNNLITNYDNQISQIHDETYIRIKIIDQKTISIEPSDAQINTAITEYLLGTELSSEELINYTNSMKDLQAKINVEANFISAQLESKNQVKPVSYVQKDLTSIQPVQKANIIEIVPKDFSRSAQDVFFSNKPQILQDDPIVQWSLAQLTSQRINYWITEQRNSNVLSLTSTVVLTPPVIVGSNNQITGQVIDEVDSESGGFWKTFSVVFLSLVVISLLGYYMASGSRSVKTPVAKGIDTEFLLKKYQHILAAAMSAVDNVQTEKAKILYQELYNLYLGLNEVDQNRAYASLNGLYLKINVLNQISKQHALLDQKRIEELHKENECLKGMISIPNGNSELKNYVESSIKYFGHVLA